MGVGLVEIFLTHFVVKMRNSRWESVWSRFFGHKIFFLNLEDAKFAMGVDLVACFLQSHV